MSHLIYFVSWLGPGPRRVLPRFRLHNKRPSATRATTKATPPTVPPTIAPVLGELDSFLGATASPVADVDGDAWVLPGSESDLVSEVVEDPMVVGVVRAVAVAVRETVMWLKCKALRPDALVATLVARLEALPQPY